MRREVSVPRSVTGCAMQPTRPLRSRTSAFATVCAAGLARGTFSQRREEWATLQQEAEIDAPRVDLHRCRYGRARAAMASPRRDLVLERPHYVGSPNLWRLSSTRGRERPPSLAYAETRDDDHRGPLCLATPQSSAGRRRNRTPLTRLRSVPLRRCVARQRPWPTGCWPFPDRPSARPAPRARRGPTRSKPVRSRADMTLAATITSGRRWRSKRPRPDVGGRSAAP